MQDMRLKLPKLVLHVLRPVSEEEDQRRREVILVIFSSVCAAFFLCAIVTSALAVVLSPGLDSREHSAVALPVLLGIVIFFISLIVLSKSGRIRTASYLLVGAIIALAFYSGLRWGIDATASLLFSVFAIVMAGVLIDSRHAFVVALHVGISLGLVAYIHEVGLAVPDRYWTGQPWRIIDTVVVTLFLLVIATVSWLSNREIERSFARARRSEAELKVERDSLELKVEERTRELRASEMENMRQSYRFLEFGRMAGALVHDLTGPLAALSLNIDDLERKHGSTHPGNAMLTAMTSDIERARSATEHMQKLTESMRRHLADEGVRVRFQVGRVVEEVASVLRSYARQRRVSLCTGTQDAWAFGDPTAFAQAVSNLVTNAIESFDETDDDRERVVKLEVRSEADEAILRVRDNGPGMADDVLQRIFDPFYTTKKNGGIGIGLPLARRSIEKGFGGTLTGSSEVGKGSVFTIRVPEHDYAED